jgi:DUF4097 and DUF4098 domain-containing protein YvlB
MPMSVKRLRVATLAALLLLGSQVAAVAERFTERFERTLDVPPGVELSLTNTNGHVEIETWDRTSVEIVAEKRVNVRDAQAAREALEKLRIAVREGDGRLEIETEYPSGAEGLFDRMFGRSSNASVQYELRVPRGAKLEIRTVNGSIETLDSDGTQRLRSTNGRIEVTAAASSVSAHTTNGAIDVELTSAERDPEIDLGTTNGSIRLHLPSDTRASLEARTVNGRVSTELPVTLEGSASRKRLRADLNGGGEGRIVLRTTNGSIRIFESV